MSENSCKAVVNSFKIDLQAADDVFACTTLGLRAYVEAGGLVPAKSFIGLDLTGWNLVGQDLRGFNFTECDLRQTKIEYALTDAKTVFDRALIDDGCVPGSKYKEQLFTSDDLAKLKELLVELIKDGHIELAQNSWQQSLYVIKSQVNRSINDEEISTIEKLLKHTIFDRMYEESIDDPDAFWDKQGQRLEWIKQYSKVKNTSFEEDVVIRWYEDGTLNACVNCVDRHLSMHATRTAIIWEGDSPSQQKHISYAELYREVCHFANVLKKHGVKKGDCVTIYMPMIPEVAYAMLACARIGAVHSIVFAGFSPDSLRDRILDCGSKLVITADEGVRAGRKVPLKANMDKALESCPLVEDVIVVRRTGSSIEWVDGRDFWHHEESLLVDANCPPEEMNAEDPLFILYTSGSTNMPKGVVHTTGGYMVYASLTHQFVFDYHDGEVYWCTADVGWVTGHSYVVYGPLANGATTLMFEGVPHYPDPSRFWQVVDKHKVNIFYTAPTAIRSLMRDGDQFVTCTSRKSLRLLASVGEPINPEAWLWYHRVVGEERCLVIDTWWQTETGGILIAPDPCESNLQPGSVGKPFFGIKPTIIDSSGKPIQGAGEGNLCLSDSWPGQARTLWGNHERFKQNYFSFYQGMYFTGDGCRRDADGYYWITGRVDDIINVYGQRLGTAEIESALVALAEVAEAAVVGFPHDIKGQGIYAYVTLHAQVEESEELRKAMIQRVKKEIGAVAVPDHISFLTSIPKTSSGKIMRRILRKITVHNVKNINEDISHVERDMTLIETAKAHKSKY